MSFKKREAVIIGITGSFGTGKTTVAKMFKALGATVLDADKLAHASFKKGTNPYKKIVNIFGRRILDRFGRIDRIKLAHLVFRNKKSLNKLCNIIHPVVVDKIMESIEKILRTKTAPAVVIDAPLLVEAGLHKVTDYLIVVKTSRPTQIKRVMKKTGLPASQIIKRIKNQIPLIKKIQMADYVINNEGDKRDTKKFVKEAWRKIKNK